MSENDLFGAADAPESMTRPLAVRMRPRTLDEVIGQTQVLGQGSPLRRLANPASKGSLTAPSSVILFGPPGVGKTTLATIVAGQSGRVFEELSAVTSGVKDVRDVLTRAHERLVSRGQETVLFIDEVHRFSKSQHRNCEAVTRQAVVNRRNTYNQAGKCCGNAAQKNCQKERNMHLQIQNRCGIAANRHKPRVAH